MGSRPVVAVTGASGGIGRATAVAFAEHGYDVALLARGRAGLEAAAKEVEAAGGRALVVEADVAMWDDVDAAAGRVEAELGPLDVWVNNAMATVFAPINDISPDEIKRATEVTYLGQVHGTLAALRRMKERDRGHIVSVGSSLSYVGIPLQAPYCGAKFACRGFFESVRAELLDEGSGVAISMVHLPAVNTPQFDWALARVDRQPEPVAPIYRPEVAAAAIVGAALDGRRSKILGVWNKLVVAGASVAPAVIHHFIAQGGKESQLGDQPINAERPANLWEPADATVDFGSNGRFDDKSGGVLDPSFVATLPGTLAALARAVGDAVGEVAGRWRRPRR